MGTKSAPVKAKAIDKLIAVKRTAVATDGRFEVAMAIAGTSNLVSVNPTAHPFTTIPDNLFDLAFKDDLVGIDDEEMEVFKANLTLLLPNIKADIAQIEDDSSVIIDKIAEFIEISLQIAGGN